MGTKLSIPAREKEIYFLIEEPVTNQEKEEYYELNLYISTFVSEETPTEDTSRLQIIIKPPTAQREETQTKQLVTNPAKEKPRLYSRPRGER